MTHQFARRPAGLPRSPKPLNVVFANIAYYLVKLPIDTACNLASGFGRVSHSLFTLLPTEPEYKGNYVTVTDDELRHVIFPRAGKFFTIEHKVGRERETWDVSRDDLIFLYDSAQRTLAMETLPKFRQGALEFLQYFDAKRLGIVAGVQVSNETVGVEQTSTPNTPKP